jgi:uncharacterized membrane protein YdbT with pleckstrin-like domain
MTEKVLGRLHSTRLLFLRYYFVSLILFVIGFALFFDLLPARGFFPKYYYLSLPIVALIPIIVSEIKRRNDVYTLTQHRIIERIGILNIIENSTNWDKISSYTVKQNFIERIVNIGTIDLWSVGEEIKPQVTLKKIPHIKRLREVLDKLIRRKTGPVV